MTTISSTSTIEQLMAVNDPPPIGELSDNSTMDKEDFLLLLITQMKYQNPLEPIKNEQFAAQLAQFSSLEQLTNLNETTQAALDSDLALTNTISNSMTANLVGKLVLADSDTMFHQKGQSSTVQYTLDDNAQELSVRVSSLTGGILFEENLGAQISGKNAYTWNGLDANGAQVADGSYKIEFIGKNVAGEEVGSTVQTAGLITSVRFRDGEAFLVVNNVELPMSEVKEILHDFYGEAPPEGE